MTLCLMETRYTRTSRVLLKGVFLNPDREAIELELSEDQRETFAGWRRPTETFGRPRDGHHQIEPVTMTAINPIDLVQDITTDCSVVASLCAGTARALKGHGKVFLLLSTSHVYC